ncbi:MAG: hypothetical protein AAFY28_20905, partial [Actinomycetota bacterium]
MLVLLSCAGCVTERIERKPGAEPRRVSDGPIVDEPIASPAFAARVVNSRVLAEVGVRGTVPFDGQVLPLISPDGRYVATQTGEAPTWPTLLAERGQVPPTRTFFEQYRMRGRTPRDVS